MIDFGHSIHSEFAGQTLEWFGSDSLNNYNYYLSAQKEQLEKNGWIDAKLTYVFNEHGFRSESFNQEPSIVFLGASDTLGTGIPIEHTWSYLVAQQLGLRYYNLGQGGGSGSTSFRLASHWLPKLNPKVVVFMSPLNPRFELAYESDGDKVYHQLAPDLLENRTPFWKNFKNDRLKTDLQSFYRQWIMSDDNLILLQKKNELAISVLASNVGAKFVLADSELDWNETTCDLSRDLMHGGIESNRNVARLILDRIS